MNSTDESPCLVTGAAGGIGSEVVRQLLSDGRRVVATWNRTVPPFDEAPNLIVAEADVTVRASIETALSLAARDFGDPVLHVAHCAGVALDGLLLKPHEAATATMIDVNIRGTLNVVSAALRAMLRKRHGRFVIVSSVAGFMGATGQGVYAATKASQLGICRSVTREYGGRDIGANVVAPGPIDTKMIDGVRERLELVAGLSPLGRLGAPQDVAAIVSFLLSSRASYIVGALIPVDGGLSMGI